MILVYGLSKSSNCDDLDILEGILLLQAFGSVTFRIVGASRDPSASAVSCHCSILIPDFSLYRAVSCHFGLLFAESVNGERTL